MISPECPSLNALMAFLTESQQGHGDSTIEQHLDQCESCLQRLENLYTPITPGSDEFKSAHHSSRQSTTDSGEFFLNRLKSSFPRQLPNQIGPFQVLRLLAEGGTGDVYECRDTRLNRRVAVKTIRPQMLKHRVLERLKQEARIQGTLSHDNIVPLHEFGTNSDGMPYLVMEMIDGGTLSDLVREKPLSPTAAARLIATCAHAVHYAHEKGVLHRDLKPSNILIANHRPERQEKISLADRDHLVPKITDFGLAKLFDNDSRRITQSGTVLGTPSYMSPEQANGGTSPIGRQSDVYALGVILYECITGRPPFFSDNVAITLRMIQENEPLSPQSIQPDVSRDLNTICMKCLEKTPERRYPTALALAEELERFVQGQPIKARPMSLFGQISRWCGRNKRLAGALTLMCLSWMALGLGGYWFAYQQAALRRLADVRAAEAKVAEQKAITQSDLARNHFMSSIYLSLDIVKSLSKLENLDNPRQAIPPIKQQLEARIARSASRLVNDYMTRLDQDVIDLDNYFKNAMEVRGLGFVAESTPVFERLMELAKRTNPTDKHYGECMLVGMRSATILGLTYQKQNNPAQAINVLADAWRQWPISPAEFQGLPEALIRDRLVLGTTYQEMLNQVARHTDAKALTPELLALQKGMLAKQAQK